jgi:hypothetical protein
MIKATRIGHTIVCFINEKMYQKTFQSEEEIIKVYELILNTSDSDEDELTTLKEIFSVPKSLEDCRLEEEFKQLKETQQNNESLLTWMEEIKNSGDEYFEVKGISLYVKGIGISIPEFLASEFLKRKDNEEDLKSLTNFWRLLSLNSDPRCREDLYKFLINNNMVVTPSGYFLAYRNANIKKEASNNELFETVNLEWTKIKGQKKSPKNYTLLVKLDNSSVEGPKYLAKQNSFLENLFNSSKSVEGYQTLGNVQELYEQYQNNEQSVEEATTYTDAHSGTTEIIIGKPVKISRMECDANPNQTCSKGLHLGSINFMTKNYYGSVGLVCLCNPMNVVAVPYTDGQKLRTCEYLPIGIAEYDDNGKIIPIESATFEYDFAEYTEAELVALVESASFESLKEHRILPLEISYDNFKNIINSLVIHTQEMKDKISNRVIKV